FVAELGGTSEVKTRNFPVLAEYVPMTFKVEDKYSWSEVEIRNNLATDNISGSRWIKPVEKRYQGQRFAHLIINFTTPEAANEAIRKGLIIASKRVGMRKLLIEPRRCLCCQRFDGSHLAKECKHAHETCRMCRDIKHKTSEYTIEDVSKFYCINCKVKGHTSWSRNCPTFLMKRERLMLRLPESTYVFYPTANPRTW
ncbi:hypothetical protein OBBRIDRAFT_699215, partial [Obba rivulosa]